MGPGQGQRSTVSASRQVEHGPHLADPCFQRPVTAIRRGAGGIARARDVRRSELRQFAEEPDAATPWAMSQP